MGYCEDPTMVRVDFFKKSGKCIGLTSVCIQPHHEHEHPLMITIGI